MTTALNVQILEELADDLGDADFLRETVAAYLLELPGRRAEIRAAFEEDDRTGLRARAHSLGSASRMLGAVDLADQCAAIERLAVSVDAAALQLLVEHWITSCTRTESALSEWLLIQGSNR